MYTALRLDHRLRVWARLTFTFASRAISAVAELHVASLCARLYSGRIDDDDDDNNNDVVVVYFRQFCYRDH